MGLTLAKLLRVLAETAIGSVFVYLWGLGGFLFYRVSGVFLSELLAWWFLAPVPVVSDAYKPPPVPCHFCGNVADGYSLTCDGCRSRLREPR